MSPLYLGLLLIFGVSSSFGVQSGWSSAPNGQYHIQTDEGPERYFKYQTQSGQYRKEKRLQDGTVVGTYGWIDANGYLRLRDYIADNEGYRILKSKTVFVGQNRPIEEAIKSSKKAPAQAGILVSPGGARPAPSRQPVKAVAIAATPAPPAYNQGYLPPSSPAVVVISHNSIESSTDAEYDFRPTVAPIAVAPFTQHPASYYSTTASPVAADVSSSTYLPPVSSTTPRPFVTSSTLSSYLPPIVTSTYSPSSSVQYASTPAPVVAITSNVLGDYKKKYYSPSYVSRHGDESLYSTKTLDLDPYSLQNTPVERFDGFDYKRTRPLNRYQTTKFAGYTDNQLGNGYDPQYSQYDGISVTRNGFRYYLPKQYHEEENSGSQTRTGSFGYVDPFGIRRVIYYNTSPGSGFVHRKNNRYVGHDATPYDPRPIQ